MTIIGHMTNTKHAVLRALEKGANGVELDWKYSEGGHPTEFRHGGYCDCSCVCPFHCTENHACTDLQNSGRWACEAKTDVETMTK